ncbi:MAG: hypothetical protein MUC96_16060 [Myxococcaceae bacterium]|nr:hypothetical protein [Myxococcaceae bacterium]
MRWLPGLVAVGLVGCTQMTGGSAGRVVGSNDVILVDRLDGLDLAGTDPALSLNRYLFVTSTDTNELRVLDLSGNCPTQLRCYLPGPNPLEALSIPVIDRPTSLAIDERYEDGVRRKGALLYATRPGGPELSIVGVAPNELREVRRVSVPAPVTALSALMVDRQTSRIFVATFDGAASVVWELRHPSTPAALRRIPTAELVGRLTARLRVPGESVVALQAIPGLAGRQANGRPFCADADKACLVVATRRNSGADGDTLLFDLETLESVKLRFPGPVRALSTSDQVTPADEALRPLRDLTPPPGALIFGVLDEEACGSPRCGGVSTVDTRGAAPAGGFEVVRSEGFPTQPVRWNDGLVVGFTVAAGGRVAANDAGVLDTAQYPLLGAITTSNGELLFFDALEQRLLEQPGPASTVGPVRFTADVLPDGGAYVAGPAVVGESTRVDEAFVATSQASIVDGALRSQELSIRWRGALTPEGGLVAPSATRLELALSVAQKVSVGDEVSFSGCPMVARVSAVSGAVVSVQGAEGCAAPGRVSIRAGSSRPFVISGSVDGLLGRSGAGETFQFFGTPAVRLAGVDPSQPLLVIPFGRDTDTTPPPAGALWTMVIDSGLTPLVSQVDVNSFGATATACRANTTLPGAVVYDVVRHRLFAAYPSANVVTEFDPSRTVRGLIGTNNGVFCYP